jgi:chorismate dehydratase
VSLKPLSPEFEAIFNTALASGIAAIPKLKLLLPSPHPDFDLETYFTKYISYNLDQPKRKALDRFLNYLRANTPLAKDTLYSQEAVN